MSVCSKSISIALLVGVGVVLAGPIATPSGLPVHANAVESRGLPVPRSPFGVKANEVTQGIPVHHRSMGPLKINLESKCPQECMVPDVHHVMCDIRKLLDWNSINPQERNTFDAKCPSSFDLDIWCDSVPKCYGALAPSGGQYGSPLASGSGYKGPLSGGDPGSGSYGPTNPLSYGPGESGPTVHGGESGPYGSGPSLGMNGGDPLSYGPGTNGADPLSYGPGNVHGLNVHGPAQTGPGNPAGSNDPNSKVDATFGNPSSNDGTKSVFAPLSPSGSSQQNGPNEIDANLGKPSDKSGLANILPNGNAPSDSGDATAHMNGPKSAFDPSLSSSGSTSPSDSTTIDIPIDSDSTSANGMGAGPKCLKKLNGPKENGQVSTGAGPQAGGDVSVVGPIVDPLFNGLKASSNDMTLEGSLGGDAPAEKDAQGGVKGLKANSGKGDAQDAQALPLLGGDDDCDCQ